MGEQGMIGLQVQSRMSILKDRGQWNSIHDLGESVLRDLGGQNVGYRPGHQLMIFVL